MIKQIDKKKEVRKETRNFKYFLSNYAIAKSKEEKIQFTILCHFIENQ